MKKLLILVLIITLPIIAYFQYANWKRYNTPANFSYQISGEIDVNYHDANMVRQYFENAVEIGRFAKDTYANTGVDVLAPENTSSDAVNASKYYHGLISSTRYIEAILIESTKSKKAGLSNEDVKLVERSGISAEKVAVYKMKLNFLNMKLGDKSNYVWQVQESLLGKKYDLPLDGNFGIETEVQLKAYQISISTYPSGILDEYTFMKLMVNK